MCRLIVPGAFSGPVPGRCSFSNEHDCRLPRRPLGTYVPSYESRAHDPEIREPGTRPEKSARAEAVRQGIPRPSASRFVSAAHASPSYLVGPVLAVSAVLAVTAKYAPVAVDRAVNAPIVDGCVVELVTVAS